MPPVKSMSKAGGLIIREAVRYDEHPSVGMPRVKKVDGQFDEVIPIARHKDTMFHRSILQLGFVIETVARKFRKTGPLTATTFSPLS